MYEGPDLTVTVSNIHFSAVWLGQESHRKIQLTALNLEKQLGEASNCCGILWRLGAWAPSDATPPKRKLKCPLKKGRFKRKVVFLFQLTC